MISGVFTIIDRVKVFTLFFIVFFLLACRGQNAERYVDVSGTKFNVKTIGKQGTPVIFESGIGSSLDSWKNIPDSVAHLTKVFAYDRAGVGKSDTIAAPRTIPNMVEELRQLLQAEKIKPPYVFVAHSMGAYVSRYYATQYPEETKALLLIDPSPDRLYDSYSEQEYKEFKDFGDKSYANSSIGVKREWENYLMNRKYVQNEVLSDQFPIVIVSATQWDFFTFHRGMMNQNMRSKHLKVEGSHDVHQEKPSLIVDLIGELLTAPNEL